MISSEELKKLSKLARIEISEKEFSALNKDINSILDYVGQITHLSDESLTDPSTTELRSGYGAGADNKTQIGADDKSKVLKNVMREDENPQEAEEFSDDLLREAPNMKDKYIRVKKIL